MTLYRNSFLWEVLNQSCFSGGSCLFVFSSLCCKCCALYSCNKLQMTLWNPLKIAASMNIPTFIRLISKTLAEIAQCKPPESLLILDKMHHNGAYMHRILYHPANEKFLITPRGVSYPHITRLVSMSRTNELWSLAWNKTFQYLSAVFLHREKLYMNRRKLPQC